MVRGMTDSAPDAPHDPPIEAPTGDHASDNPDRTDADRAADALARRAIPDGEASTDKQNSTAGPTEVEPTPGSTRGDGRS